MELQLKRIRELRKLKQQDMADALDVKKRTYGSWEREEVAMSFPQAIACAEILDCTTDELAGREKPPRFLDERQERMNRDYSALSDSGKDAAAGAVRGIRLDELSRTAEEGDEAVKPDRPAIGA